VRGFLALIGLLGRSQKLDSQRDFVSVWRVKELTALGSICGFLEGAGIFRDVFAVWGRVQENGFWKGWDILPAGLPGR